MPSLYQHNEGKSKPYYARLRVVDKETGKVKWQRVNTKCFDYDKAMVAAKTMEDFLNEGIAKDGITRHEAEAMVDKLLAIIGSKTKVTAPSFLAYGSSFIAERCAEVGSSTARKYEAHWSRFSKWDKAKIHQPMDAWDVELMQKYYRGLCAEFSATTANDHMRTISMIYIRANASGHAKGNPASLISKMGNDSVEKGIFTRSEMVQLLSFYREDRVKYSKWALLALLGWHTGHRFEDLQNMTAEEHLKEELGGFYLEFTPEKKDTARRQGKAITIPLPRYVGLLLKRLGSVFVGNNRNGIQRGSLYPALGSCGYQGGPRGSRQAQDRAQVVPLIPPHDFDSIGCGWR